MVHARYLHSTRSGYECFIAEHNQGDLGRGIAMIATASIHPFPARMAPEIALAAIKPLRHGSVILDPMAGSGTVLRSASEQGHRALGFDVDPLAVLMSRVWTAPVDTSVLLSEAGALQISKEALCPR